MALIVCKECGHRMSDKAECCPNCGCPTEHSIVNDNVKTTFLNNRKPAMKRIAILISCVLLAAVGIVLYFVVGHNTATVSYDLNPSLIETINRYEAVGECSEGKLAVMNHEGKWGYIDVNGTEVISCQYTYAGRFSDGYAAVGNDTSYGFIDENNMAVIPITYQNVGDFHDGLAPVENDKDKWGYMDVDGNWVVQPQYDFAQNLYEERGLVGKYSENGDIKMGYIDKHGAEVVPCKFDDAKRFSDGMAAVCQYKSTDEGRKSKVGFIDKEGKEVIPFIYDGEDLSRWNDIAWTDPVRNIIKMERTEIYPLTENTRYMFSDGVVAVRKGGKYGAIDKKGNTVIPFEYDEIGYFSNELAPVHKEHWGFIDTKGNIAIDCKYEDVTPFKQGFAKVAFMEGDNYRKCFINTKGEVLCDISKNAVFSYSFSEGLACAQLYNYENDSRVLYLGDDVEMLPNKCLLYDTKGNSSLVDSYKTSYETACDNFETTLKNAEENYLIEEAKGPKWLDGTWVCRHSIRDEWSGQVLRMDYTLVINRNSKTMILYDNDNYKISSQGEYSIDGNTIHCPYGSGMSLSMDFEEDSKRIDFGDGVYFRKVSSNNDTSRPQRTSTSSRSYSGGSSSNGSKRTNTFTNDYSVIAYTNERPFYSGDIKVLIDFRGLYVNNACLSSTVRVVNYSSTYALIKATTFSGTVYYFQVYPTKNMIVDGQGRQYFSKF